MSHLSSVENDLRAIEVINQRDVQFALAGDQAMMMSSSGRHDFVLLPPAGPILRGRSDAQPDGSWKMYRGMSTVDSPTA